MLNWPQRHKGLGRRELQPRPLCSLVASFMLQPLYLRCSFDRGWAGPGPIVGPQPVMSAGYWAPVPLAYSPLRSRCTDWAVPVRNKNCVISQCLGRVVQQSIVRSFWGLQCEWPQKGHTALPLNTSSIGILQPSCIVSGSIVKGASGVLLANGDINSIEYLLAVAFHNFWTRRTDRVATLLRAPVTERMTLILWSLVCPAVGQVCPLLVTVVWCC
jgi:hypothetical protein